jgi:demethylmenaquinone methyltransferase/2-methoxy-6-polyprenyl-1,4-benzoquinol methylase
LRQHPDPYDPVFVRRLFEAMAASYARVNELASLGLLRRWRRQCVGWLAPQPGDVVVDAMTGMGEGLPHLARRIGPGGRIIGIDTSEVMLGRAGRRRLGAGAPAIELRLEDALASGLEEASADGIVCLFGIKTLSSSQRDRFANEIARVLRPGGRFALVEISVPRSRALRVPYMAYLRHAIPVLGRLLLGDPEPYRMLAAYTSRFGDSRAMSDALRAAGLEAQPTRLFLGCATGVRGRRPRAIPAT